MTKQTFVFTQAELKQVLEFSQKYPDSMCVEVTIIEDGSHTVKAQVATCLNGDWVEITKTIAHGQSW